jgi:chromosome segregation ATPase
MALLKKTAEQFRVPALEDVSEEYASLRAKQHELQHRENELHDEDRKIRRAIEEDRSRAPRISSRAAALLGDNVESSPMYRQRLGEIRSELSAIAEALPELRRRLGVAKSDASTIVCAKVKPEYARRVKAMAAAVEALVDARANYDEMVDQFVANDVAWTSLVPLQPNFCGDRFDGHLQRWLKSAREAGYHV